MYIAPNSTVLVLRGVNIDSEYNHTVRFVNTTAQYDTLSAKVKYTFTPTTYQRTNRGTIRVERIADDLFDCNYLMFQNTSYGSKWFYAFLDKVNYINDKCSELEYTIDVIQSFMFDFEVGECFVEREHSITDVVGENTVPEKFNIQEYIINKEIKKISDIVDTKMYGAIIFKRGIRRLFYVNAQNQEVNLCQYVKGIIELEDPDHYPTGSVGIGVPNTLFIAPGFATGSNVTPNANYWEQTTNSSSPYGNVPNLEEILDYITWGKLYTDATGGGRTQVTVDDIVAAFIYPAGFSKMSACTAAQTLGFPVGYAYYSYNVINSEMPTGFIGKVPNDIYYFSQIKNNKLLTSPFLKMKFYNAGNSTEFNYENFIGTTSRSDWGIKLPSFKIYGNKIGNAEFVIQPKDYNFIGDNRNETIQFTESPIALYSGNALAEYMQKSSTSMNWSVVSSMMNAAVSAILSLITKNPVPAISGAKGAIDTVFSKVAQVNDLKNTPPSSTFSTSVPLFVIGADIMGGILYSEGISAESARIVDDFLDMFGYATNRVKQPNIFKYFKNTSGYYLRPHWNYVKTSGAIIHPINFYGLVRGLPAEAEKQIAQIIDKGITFWNNESEIGNYSLSNAATGVPNG